MKKNINKVKITTLVFAVVLLAILPFSVKAFGVADVVSINGLKLGSADYKNGDVIGGNFSIQNNSSESADLNYEIFLLQEGKVFDREKFQIKEQVQPGKSLDQELEYKLPINIRSGEYILKVQLYSTEGAALNWEEKELAVEGNNFFINIASSYILKEGVALDAKEVPEYYPEDSPGVEADVYNPTETAMVLVPKISFWCTDSSEAQRDSFFASEIQLLPKKNDKLKIDMPKLSQPGVYAAELELLYEGENISSIESFSWRIVNREARILDISTTGGLYYPEKENKLLIRIEGYLSEGETRNAELTVEIKDRYFNTLESQKREIEIGKGGIQEEIVSSLPVDDNSLNVSAFIKDNGKIIDSYEGKLNVRIEKKAYGQKESSLLGIIAVILTLFGAMALIAWRNFNTIRRFMENKLNI